MGYYFYVAAWVLACIGLTVGLWQVLLSVLEIIRGE